MEFRLADTFTTSLSRLSGDEQKAVMACDDEIIPNQGRIETVADESDLEEVYETERNLTYLACTRARDHLLVTTGGQPSEFLADMAH